MTDMSITREDFGPRGRYVALIDGHEAELVFTELSPTLIVADHTGVPDELKGKGAGLALVEHLVAEARAQGFRVRPMCPFVRAMYARHPEWSDVFG